MRIYREYPTEEKRRVHPAGTRLHASGFRISDPPSKIVRNMLPALVEFTYGGKNPTAEAKAKAAARNDLTTYIAPVRPDGTLDYARTSTINDLRLFSDMADAEACYRDQVLWAMEDIAEAQARLADFKTAVDGVMASAPPYPAGYEPPRA